MRGRTTGGHGGLLRLTRTPRRHLPNVNKRQGGGRRVLSGGWREAKVIGQLCVENNALYRPTSFVRRGTASSCIVGNRKYYRKVNQAKQDVS